MCVTKYINACKYNNISACSINIKHPEENSCRHTHMSTYWHLYWVCCSLQISVQLNRIIENNFYKAGQWETRMGSCASTFLDFTCETLSGLADIEHKTPPPRVMLDDIYDVLFACAHTTNM